MEAISLALSKGYGIETDLRYDNGQLVIAHDFPDSQCVGFAEFLAAVGSYRTAGVFALNVKSDGLVSSLTSSKKDLSDSDHFFFDMSFPELVRYERAGLPVAERVSEYERGHIWPDRPCAQEKKQVWLDSFDSDWWIDAGWHELSPAESRIFFVSPELHGRDRSNAWKRLKEFAREERVFGVCTDTPDEFARFMET